MPSEKTKKPTIKDMTAYVFKVVRDCEMILNERYTSDTLCADSESTIGYLKRKCLLYQSAFEQLGRIIDECSE